MKKSNCSSFELKKEEKKLKEHWDKIYIKCPDKKLGWYETDLSPMTGLILKTALNKSARILNVGAGNTTLIDKLLELDYSNLIATDLSEVALSKLEERIGKEKIAYLVDDLTNPVNLLKMIPVDLWIDRAVLHFFTEKNNQDTYFDLLRAKVKSKGFVIFAQFNINSATVCSGLPVFRYSESLLAEKLGNDFELMEAFNYTYTMPSEDTREYVYTLFSRK